MGKFAGTGNPELAMLDETVEILVGTVETAAGENVGGSMFIPA